MKARALVRVVACALIAIAASAPALAPRAQRHDGAAALPTHLRDTGLYAAGSTTVVREDVLEFSPQYPLWSDGATKRRWIRVPAGASIDGSNADAWEFPPGTRLWKEFSHGRRIETRFIQRLQDGSWRYATYVWNAQGTDATLLPDDGVTLDVSGAPGGRYTVPSRSDCVACHEGASVPVLGFGALQLSSDRDPLAPHAESAGAEHADLRFLVSRGLIRNLPQALIERPPRIDARTPTARAALGYLHGNCGHCHNDVGPLASLDLVLAQRTAGASQRPEATLESLVGRPGRYRPQGSNAQQRIVPGDANASVVALRMKSTNPLVRMPPLGVEHFDVEGLALVERWIAHDVPTPKEP